MFGYHTIGCGRSPNPNVRGSPNTAGTFGLPPTKYPAGWFNETTVDGMRAEYLSGKWNRTDDLLLASLELKNDFFWQSHTLSNQARDNLGEVDCQSEDGGKRPGGVLLGVSIAAAATVA